MGRGRGRRARKRKALLADFVASGGNVEKWYPDGRPQVWLCGRDARGNVTDAPTPGSYMHMLDTSVPRVVYGVNPTPEILAEAALWGDSLVPLGR